MRRAKAPHPSWGWTRPATVVPASSRSQPSMEVTTWTEALRCKRAAVGRLSERAGRNASERRAGLETVNAEADPPRSRGRLPATGNAKALGERTKHRLPPPG